MAFMGKSVPTYVAILGITYGLTSTGMEIRMSRGNVTKGLDYKLVIPLTCIALTGSRCEMGKWPMFVQLHRPYYVAGIHTWRRFVGYNY
jgi:hypothetical protein